MSGEEQEGDSDLRWTEYPMSKPVTKKTKKTKSLVSHMSPREKLRTSPNNNLLHGSLKHLILLGHSQHYGVKYFCIERLTDHCPWQTNLYLLK